MLMVLREVEGYPVRASLVNSAQQWLWSSHKERVGEKPELLIDGIPIELPDNWSRYVGEPLKEKELERRRQSVNRQSPYGTPIGQMNVGKELGLESTLRPRGRPREKVEKS